MAPIPNSEALKRIRLQPQSPCRTENDDEVVLAGEERLPKIVNAFESIAKLLGRSWIRLGKEEEK